MASSIILPSYQVMQLDQNIDKDWVWHTYSPVKLDSGRMIFVPTTPAHFARPLLSSQSTPSGRPVFSRLMLPTNIPTETTSKSYVSNESGSKRRKLQPATGAVEQNQQAGHPVLKIIWPDNVMHNTAQSSVTVTSVTDDNELACQVLCELSNHKPVHRSQVYSSRADVTEDELETSYAGERSTDSSSATRSESSPLSSPPRQALFSERPKSKRSDQDDDDDYDDKRKSERRRKPRYRIKRKAHVLQPIKPDPATAGSSPQFDVSKKSTPMPTSLFSVDTRPAQSVQSRRKKPATLTPATAALPVQKSQWLTIHVSKPVQQVFAESNPEPKKHKRAAINRAGRKMAELLTTDSACSAPLAMGRTRFTVAIP